MTKDKPLVRVDHCSRAGCGDLRCKALAVILIRPEMAERADEVLMPYISLQKADVRELIKLLTELERGMQWPN